MSKKFRIIVAGIGLLIIGGLFSVVSNLTQERSGIAGGDQSSFSPFYLSKVGSISYVKLKDTSWVFDIPLSSVSSNFEVSGFASVSYLKVGYNGTQSILGTDPSWLSIYGKTGVGSTAGANFGAAGGGGS